jgi:glycine betaine/choline ABC-type transport system substrate-binding protein
VSHSGFRPARKDPAPDRATAYSAVAAGTVQLVVDTAGDLRTQLEPDGDEVATTEELVTALKAALPTTLTIGASTPAQLTDVVACKADEVGPIAVDRLSLLQERGGFITIAGPSELTDQMPGLADYIEATTATAGASIVDGDAQCAIVSSLDPVISSQSLVILTDDLGLAAPNPFVPLLATTAATPEVLQVLDVVSQNITPARLAAMVAAVVEQGQDPDVVAKSFLNGTFENIGTTTTVALGTVPPGGLTVPPVPIPTDTTPANTGSVDLSTTTPTTGG